MVITFLIACIALTRRSEEFLSALREPLGDRRRSIVEAAFHGFDLNEHGQVSRIPIFYTYYLDYPAHTYIQTGRINASGIE